VNVNDLLDIRLPVDVAGRRFFVRRIRLSDVLRILTRFDDEIRAFASKKERSALDLIGSLDKDDTADLFAFAMDPHDPLYLREHLDLQKRGEIAILIAAVNDLDRIWSSVRIGSPDPKAEPGGVEPIGVTSRIPTVFRIVDLLACRYGIDPMKIPDWNYEAFLDFVEIVDEEKKAQRDAESALGIPLPDGSYLDLDLVDDSRIVAGPIPDLNTKVS